jgi:hypothetical protein
VVKIPFWGKAKGLTKGAAREAVRFKQRRQRRRRTLQHGRELLLVQDNTRAIRANDVVLVSCLRNEIIRMPFFLQYYRDMGVDRFLFIDNGSTDGFLEWIRPFDDCSVWHTQASYLASDFGMQWCNYLLSRYGSGHLCVTVDPDEFLVYPHVGTRNLKDLGVFLKDDERSSMHVLLLDAYGEGTLSDTVYRSGDDPFAVCPFFDCDGYIQRPGINNSTWIQGGPRMRVYSRDNPELAPALNKMPVVWWRRDYLYRSSMHDGYPVSLNRAHIPGEVSITGCLFHFKLVSLLMEKAKEEAHRKQHYADGREYRSYRNGGEVRFYQPGISLRYESPEQLMGLGLMSAGSWI